MNVNVDVRIGKVTDVNKKKRLVRVKFEDTGITSGWLPVMQHSTTRLSYTPRKRGCTITSLRTRLRIN